MDNFCTVTRHGIGKEREPGQGTRATSSVSIGCDRVGLAIDGIAESDPRVHDRAMILRPERGDGLVIVSANEVAFEDVRLFAGSVGSVGSAW